jgi:hypothetical protein
VQISRVTKIIRAVGPWSRFIEFSDSAAKIDKIFLADGSGVE